MEQRASLFVGTEAALHRVRRPDVVVFADFDQELFAPRFRASEIAAGLVVSAARQVDGGAVVVQTHAPGRHLLQALRDRRFDTFAQIESNVRRELALPPFSVVVSFGGAGGAEAARSLTSRHDLLAWSSGEKTVVRFLDANQLILALEGSAGELHRLKDVRMHVDPPRL